MMWYLKSGNFNKISLGIFLLAAGVRLWKIGVIPPVISDTSLVLRLATAVSGIGSVIVLYVLVNKLFKNVEIAHWAAFFLAISPWHVAESRIMSPMVLVSFLFLLSSLILVSCSKKIRIVGWFLGSFALLTFFYFSWVFKNFSVVTLSAFIKNVLKYLSFDFLFFFNDAFWWGGFKEVGAFIIPTIFPMLLGFYVFFFSQKRLIKIFGALFSFILIFSALSPTNPETQEFFLAIPLMVTIMGIGMETFHKVVEKHKLNALFIFLLCIVGFEMVRVWHLYTVHYQIRVQNEIHNEKRVF